ncbi:MAG: outer membrane beta-barrel protein [Acidobacteria bacterium]|nr:outer membrane beta-barrel protein [Acidobacteriota bacterium]
MRIVRTRSLLALATSLGLAAALLVTSITPASAQNKKKAWEVYIYFGDYGSQTVPTAIQRGVVTTYRLDPTAAEYIIQDPNTTVRTVQCVICKNLGATGPNDQFLGPIASNTFTAVEACPRNSGEANANLRNGDPNSSDPFGPPVNFNDECDDDMEAKYVYNAKGIVTNHDVQVNASEFLLGMRFGYNFTRHWEAEMDLGFTKQRLDMTQNLIPILRTPVSNPADPYFQRLADFYEFTWANRDYITLGFNPVTDQADPNIIVRFTGLGEIPNVPQHRYSKNAAADIPAVLPMPSHAAETFPDVTAFVNRILLNPGALRNRANQINTNIFSNGVSAVYNFNTKPDKRLVPYLQAGIGIWQRKYDAPYKGENSNYYTYGGGARFFVNEIFSFRFDLRQIIYQQSTATITGKLGRQDLIDTLGFAQTCMRDQDPPLSQPPQECDMHYLLGFNGSGDPLPFGFSAQAAKLPPNSGAGGRASFSFVTATDNFWEARVGFDVLLGGK